MFGAWTANRAKGASLGLGLALTVGALTFSGRHAATVSILVACVDWRAWRWSLRARCEGTNAQTSRCHPHVAGCCGGGQIELGVGAEVAVSNEEAEVAAALNDADLLAGAVGSDDGGVRAAHVDNCTTESVTVKRVGEEI